MSLLITLVHMLSNILLGSCMIKIAKASFNKIAFVPIAFVLGAFAETLLGFCLVWANIYEFMAFYISTLIGIIFWLYLGYRNRKSINLKANFNFNKLKLIEWILITPIFFKIFLALLYTIRFPLYFDDAMTHWSGRARALYGFRNWSMDSASSNFLGKQFGFEEYPLFLVIWRSISAHLNGGWDDIIAKADSWVFFVLIIMITYAFIKKLTKIRWCALGGALAVSAIPLIWYHSFSGYSEIAITYLVLITAYCLLTRNIIIAAIATACLIWTKNEGLFIFLPAFSVVITIYTFLKTKYKLKKTIVDSTKYFGFSLLFISPWILFKQINNIAWTVPLKAENYYHEGSIEMFVEMLFSNPTNSIVWIALCMFLITGILKWYKSAESIFLISLLSICFVLFIYVFCFSRSNIFMVNQMTIHRSFLQIAPLAIVLIFQIANLHRKTNLNQS